MAFFFPQAYADIDWSKGYEFLDKELQKVVRDAELGRRLADKLIKVWRHNGEEAWVLIHIEVQGQVDAGFAKRMYTYNYRLFDRYDKPVASLAVLADEGREWRPDHYSYGLWGSQAGLWFPTVKLLDYRQRWSELEDSDNPFAMIVMAHLQVQATRHQPAERLKWKVSLVRRLYERDYEKQDILELFRFIDWLMELPEELTEQFEQMLVEYEEAKQVEYITSIERLGMKRGFQQGVQQGDQQGFQRGLQQGEQRGFQQGEQKGTQKGLLKGGRENIIEVLQVRFDAVPERVAEAINAIDQLETLKFLLKQAITVASLEEFEALLEK